MDNVTAMAAVDTTQVVYFVLASILVQVIKLNESKLLAWIGPESNKTLQAVVMLLSVAGDILAAAQTPGGLAAMDWAATLKLVFENAAVVWIGMQSVYFGLLKPHEKKPS